MIISGDGLVNRVERKRIILVEDNLIIRMFYESVLQSMGFEIAGKSTSGEEALALARKLRPDFVLLDVGIEGKMNGIETGAILKNELKIPVIIITGDTAPETIASIKAMDPTHWMAKPVDAPKLNDELVKFLW